MRYLTLCILGIAMTAGACKRDSPSGVVDPRSPAQTESDSAGASGSKSNPWKNAGCDLVTDEEVQQLFKVDPQADALNTRTLPDQAFCMRTWNKPDWKERENNNEKPEATYLEPRNRLVVQVFNYHTDQISVQQFDLLKRDRRDIYEEDVSGLGDAALWSTSSLTLLVKKGHLVLSIMLEYSDTPHDNLAMARQVAETALLKM
jgi:hypothetical protein